MSSRYYDGECDEYWPMIRWRGAVLASVRGKHGQAMLKELEDALLAMPEHRLISGAIGYQGEVCAVGALIAHRKVVREGLTWSDAVAEVEAETGGEHVDSSDTAEWGRRMGFSYALAWEIGYRNDEWFEYLSSEQRWQAVLDLVRAWQTPGNQVFEP